MPVVSTPVPADQRRFVLAAREGSTLHARLEARFLSPRLFYADRFYPGSGGDAPAAWRAFAQALAAAYAGEGGGVLVWDRPKDTTWREALEGVGFRVARRKAFVERDLGTELPASPTGLLLRSLADVGESAFTARMFESSDGDPFEERKGTNRDLDAEWRELVDYAGKRFDPECWLLVDDEDGPVGVVLPQAITEDTGTLFYVGVVPERRSAGLGRALHALGLGLLARAGLKKYVGSTDLRNEGMRRIFEANGCRVTATQLFLELSHTGGRRAAEEPDPRAEAR
ncbi:MAG: GNAT family N-acetyltransferase [Planctomycetota bacterium]